MCRKAARHCGGGRKPGESGQGGGSPLHHPWDAATRLVSGSAPSWVPAPYRVRGRLYAGATKALPSLPRKGESTPLPCAVSQGRSQLSRERRREFGMCRKAARHCGGGRNPGESGQGGGSPLHHPWDAATRLVSGSAPSWVPAPYRVRGRLYAGSTKALPSLPRKGESTPPL